MKIITLFYVSLLSVSIQWSGAAKQAPNIVVFLADDMGWADVGYHSDHMLTPNIDSLAADGVVLNHYYTQPLCSPSRGALLTGVHPIHTGLQNSVILHWSPTGLPLNFKLWPQYLKDAHNYSTHIVGKWHLGHARKEFTPTYRGFDSHVGFWGAGQHYYNHSDCYFKGDCYLDFYHNMDVIRNASDIYSTDYFTDRCLHIIDQQNTSQPLFLYVPYQAVHSARVGLTLEAPQKYIDMFAYIESDVRQKFAAMAYSMDASIGTVMQALHNKHMLDNSIVIFISDNGGDPLERVGNGASNRPLRGAKFGLFEGGIRVPALVWSPLLNKSGYVSDALIHVTDLLPTVLDAIDGTDIQDQQNIYGVSQWDVLSNNDRPVRWEIYHNVDPVWNGSAILWHDWKLVQTPNPSSPSMGDWRSHQGYTDSQIMLNNTNLQSFPTRQSTERRNSKTYGVLSAMNRKPDYSVLTASTVECPPLPSTADTPTDCKTKLCLFNIRHDPCERHDLIGEIEAEFVSILWDRLVEFNRTAVRPLTLTPNDYKNSDPTLFNNTIVNWLDYMDNSDGKTDSPMSLDRTEL